MFGKFAKVGTMLAACLAVSAVAQTPAAPAAPAQQASPCQTPEHRQFDFWVGRWDVYATGSERLVAHSLIENLYNGCAIRENWMPLQGGGGGSLNAWRPTERRWRQSYTGAGNGWTEYFGGLEGMDMVLTATVQGQNGTGLVKMTFTQLEGGSIRQHGTVSTDEGKTWQSSFDFTYRRAPAGG